MALCPEALSLTLACEDILRSQFSGQEPCVKFWDLNWYHSLGARAAKGTNIS